MLSSYAQRHDECIYVWTNKKCFMKNFGTMMKLPFRERSFSMDATYKVTKQSQLPSQFSHLTSQCAQLSRGDFGLCTLGTHTLEFAPFNDTVRRQVDGAAAIGSKLAGKTSAAKPRRQVLPIFPSHSVAMGPGRGEGSVANCISRYPSNGKGRSPSGL